MTAKVVGQSGKAVEVATLDDIASGTELPVASSTVLGGVTVGTNIKVDSNGNISIPVADYESLGLVTKGAPVDDTQTIEVTDINSAATAIAAIGTTLTQLQNSLRDVGIIVKPD